MDELASAWANDVERVAIAVLRRANVTDRAAAYAKAYLYKQDIRNAVVGMAEIPLGVKVWPTPFYP